MRRLLTVMLFILLVLPFAASAQDELAWKLSSDNYIDVQDLGFRFYFPTGWSYDVSSGKGIFMGETQAEVDAQIDDDDSTNPEGLAISIRGLPLEAFTADLGEDPSLDDIVDFVVELAGVEEVERAQIPIMTRRSLSIFGENEDGRYGVASMWLQNGYLVFASLGGPDAATINDLAYTWGATLGSIEPLEAEELGDGTLLDDASSFSITYPDGWTPDPNQPVLVYELEEDIGKNISEVSGHVFTFSDAALSDLNLDEDATIDDLVTQGKAAFDLDDTAVEEEFIILGQPAVTITGAPASDSGGAGHGLILTVAKVEDRAVLLILVTPSLDAVQEFMPTWVNMLRSITSTDTTE